MSTWSKNDILSAHNLRTKTRSIIDSSRTAKLVTGPLSTSGTVVAVNKTEADLGAGYLAAITMPDSYSETQRPTLELEALTADNISDVVVVNDAAKSNGMVEVSTSGIVAAPVDFSGQLAESDPEYVQHNYVTFGVGDNRFVSTKELTRHKIYFRGPEVATDVRICAVEFNRPIMSTIIRVSGGSGGIPLDDGIFGPIYSDKSYDLISVNVSSPGGTFNATIYPQSGTGTPFAIITNSSTYPVSTTGMIWTAGNPLRVVMNSSDITYSLYEAWEARITAVEI